MLRWPDPANYVGREKPVRFQIEWLSELMFAWRVNMSTSKRGLRAPETGEPMPVQPSDNERAPLLGKRMRAPLGDGISIIALIGTVFGVATSMGIGVVLLSV